MMTFVGYQQGAKAYLFMNKDNKVVINPHASRFTHLILGHAPTGEYQRRFFPHKPRGCTCFTCKQTHAHLLTECLKYSHKFASIIAFNKADNNTAAILTYLQKNPTTFTFEDEPIDLFEPL